MLDVGAAAWRSLKDAPPRDAPPAVAGATLTAVDYAGIVLYGGAGKKVNGEAWVLTPPGNGGSTTRWQRLALAPGSPTPPPRHGHTAVLAPGGRVIIYGGAGTDGGALGDVWELDMGARFWTRRDPTGPPSLPRFSHAAALTPCGAMFVFGGCSGEGGFLNDGALLILDTFTWAHTTPVGPSPPPRYGAAAASVAGRVLLFGGSDARQPFGGIVSVSTDLGTAGEDDDDTNDDASATALLPRSSFGASAPTSPTAGVASSTAALATALRRRNAAAAHEAAAKKAAVAAGLFRAERARADTLAAELAAARMLLEEAAETVAEDKKAADVARRAAASAEARVAAVARERDAARAATAAAAAAAASLRARVAAAEAREATADERARAAEAARDAARADAAASRAAAGDSAAAATRDALASELRLLRGDPAALAAAPRADLVALEETARATRDAAAAALRAADAAESRALRAALAERDAALAARAPPPHRASECGLCLAADVGAALDCGHLTCGPCGERLVEGGAVCPWCEAPVTQTRRVLTG